MEIKIAPFFIVLLLICGCSNGDDVIDKSKINGFDYRLFQNTMAWELAKATRDDDIDKIKEEINKNHNLVEFRDPKFGQSILQLAVKTVNYPATEILLKLGADPNMQDTYSGASPLMEAARIDLIDKDTYGGDPRFLLILLKFGGNPNAEEKGKRTKGNNTRYRPLLHACMIRNFEYVKILVNAGAKVDYRNEFNTTPLRAAVLAGNPEIVLFLINKGANYKLPLITTIKDENLYITNLMRQWTFDLHSEDYKQKMKLVDFLKLNGMDYRKTVIPSSIIDNYSKEYLEQY